MSVQRPALILPRHEDILALQERETSWHLSCAFDLVLQKHGLLGFDPTHEAPEDVFGFMVRGVPWAPEMTRAPLILEAPLHPTVIDALGLEGETFDTEDIVVQGAGLDPKSLSYSRCLVRRIPARAQEHSEPFPHSCADPRWRRDSFPVTFFRTGEKWSTLLEGRTSDGRSGNLAITDGRRIILGMPVFDMAVYQHCLPPLGDAGYYAMSKSHPTWALEVWLVEQAERLFCEQGCTTLRAANWPKGFSSAFSVRHDMDRPVTRRDLREVLRFYEAEGIGATFFFLPRTASPALMRHLRRQGHEIALHTESSTPEGMVQERRRVEQTSGGPVKGFSTHGGCGGVGYLGATHFQWGTDLGFAYGELIGKDNKLPHPAVVLRNGHPTSSSLTIPAVHNSLDTGMAPDAHNMSVLPRHYKNKLAAGGHGVLMNHPDIHRQQLLELLSSLDLGTTWKASLGEVCAWNAALKFDSRVQYGPDRILLNLGAPLSHDAVVHISGPTGRAEAVIAAGDAGIEIDPSAPSHRPVGHDEPLRRFFPTIERLIRQDFENSGLKQDAAASTVALNTTLLERRARRITALLGQNKRSRIAELGCGFGFLALGLHADTNAHITGFDINPRFLQLGRGLLADHPELRGGLDFRKADYASDVPGPETFDAAVLNNTFCYITGRKRQARALANIRACLRPGGTVCFYHFNPWFLREPFTKLPFVHWLPRQLGDSISRRLGRRRLTDLHYISPLRLAKMLAQAGFHDMRFYPDGENAFSWRHPVRRFTSYYAFTARAC